MASRVVVVIAVVMVSRARESYILELVYRSPWPRLPIDSVINGRNSAAAVNVRLYVQPLLSGSAIEYRPSNRHISRAHTSSTVSGIRGSTPGLACHDSSNKLLVTSPWCHVRLAARFITGIPSSSVIFFSRD